MTKYPDSDCEDHKNVATSTPVCIICMGNEIEQLRADNAMLREHISRIADYQQDRDWQMMGISIREAADYIAMPNAMFSGPRPEQN